MILAACPPSLRALATMRETRGFFDACELRDGGAAHLEAWAATLPLDPVTAQPQGEEIEGLEVRCGGERVDPRHIEMERAASADVAAVHPGLLGAGRARFHLRIPPRPDGQPRFSDCLVW